MECKAILVWPFCYRRQSYSLLGEKKEHEVVIQSYKFEGRQSYVGGFSPRIIKPQLKLMLKKNKKRSLSEIDPTSVWTKKYQRKTS